MTSKIKILNKLSIFLTLSTLVLVVVTNEPAAKAAELSNRSVTISSASPLAVTNETYQFFVQNIYTMGSIVFEFCSNSPLIYEPCTAPTGLDVSGANLISQTGNTGFSIDSATTTANKLVISRAPLNTAVITTAYQFSNIINPSAGGATTFVRISTYASNDGSGNYTDNGTVAFATENIFDVGASVPPFLKICVGITVAPDCSSISGDTLNLGILSPNHANAGQSQFASGSNSATGYTVYSLGTTMTSGNNIIPALAFPSANFPGTGQFGINLRVNLSPPVGQDPVGTGTATPTANYNTPNRYMFSDGDSVAITSIPSDYNRMTVSYLVNIPPNQLPGVYSTTITYLAVAQF
ncbi:MAG: hypothetical protein ACREGG_04260 [Candidatus Saccharimonadales bacterium]